MTRTMLVIVVMGRQNNPILEGNEPIHVFKLPIKWEVGIHLDFKRP